MRWLPPCRVSPTSPTGRISSHAYIYTWREGTSYKIHLILNEGKSRRSRCLLGLEQARDLYSATPGGRINIAGRLPANHKGRLMRSGACHANWVGQEWRQGREPESSYPPGWLRSFASFTFVDESPTLEQYLLFNIGGCNLRLITYRLRLRLDRQLYTVFDHNTFKLKIGAHLNCMIRVSYTRGLTPPATVAPCMVFACRSCRGFANPELGPDRASGVWIESQRQCSTS